MSRPDDSTPFWKREFHVDVGPLVRWIREHPDLSILIIGVFFQMYAYLWNRAMWLDEMSLRGNVVDVAILDFSKPLWNDQLAPLGFLIIERAMATFISGRNLVLRSLPIAAGLGSLFLFRRLAIEVMPRRAALVALALFAVSDDLIYYSSEFKPYALDLFFGLAITLRTLAMLRHPPSVRDVTWMVVLLVVSPWFSFASAFVVAGCGLVLLGDALTSRGLRLAVGWMALGLGWLAVFFIAYEASHALLSPYTSMYRFWDFAFLPLTFPPTWHGLVKSADLLLEVFVNPLNLLTVPGYRAGVLVPLLLMVAGAVAMARRMPREFLLLIAPIALALGASVARRYPFHGRLLLELMPAMFLMIAEGTEWVARRFPDRRGIIYRATLVLLLAAPCWDVLMNLAGRPVREFNIHGDLHRNVFIDRDLKR